jgi:hypothetical protein
LAAAGIPIHKQVGETYWLTFLNEEQIKGLEALDLTFSILDEDPAGQDYFLVNADTPNTRPGLWKFGDKLTQVDNQIIVAVDKTQVDEFFGLRYEIERISESPIPYPQLSFNLSSTPLVTPHPTIGGMLSNINKSVVYKLVGDLSGEWPVTINGDSYTFVTRNTSKTIPIEKATQYVYEQFESFGLDVAYHEYTHAYFDGPRRNVIAEQTGIGQPERIFLLTAHLDDMPSGPLAPGADDNASGSAGVLLAAQVLSQYEFDCTLRYALFTGEEQGLIGSQFYASDAYDAGDDIEAVLNLDMIAYDSDQDPILDLHTRSGNSGDLLIANTFAGVIDAYDINLTANIFQYGMGYSDHASFWDYGFPAILAIEDNDDFTPYYHTTGDTLATLDTIYFANFVKASLATFTHLGCLLPDYGGVEGTITTLHGSAPVPGVSIEALYDEIVIETTTSDLSGSYSLRLPVGTYAIAANHPDYVSETVTDIEVSTNITKTVDLALETIFQPYFFFLPTISK